MTDVKMLDFRGVKCPEPLVKVIREVTCSDKTLIVLTDIDECVRLIAEAITGFNLGYIEIINKGTYYILKISKTN